MQRTFGRSLGILGGLAFVLTLAGTVPAGAQNMESGGLPARTYVAVRSKGEPALTQANVRLKEAGKTVTVTGLSPVLSRGKGIELAFVLDDSLRGNVSLQLNDIKAFFSNLQPGVTVFVGYMQNGRVVAATQGFTAEKEPLMKSLRMPQGVPGGNASPYFCLSDLVKNWPARNSDRARVVFMITNGVDNYTGVNPMDQNSPYVDAAIHDAQRAGVLVYSLYYGDHGVGGGAASFSGQNYLDKVAQETGGVSYYQGSFNPVSFTPFLDKFHTELSQLFELKFLSHGSGLQQIKVSTSLKGVKLASPEQVFVGERD